MNRNFIFQDDSIKTDSTVLKRVVQETPDTGNSAVSQIKIPDTTAGQVDIETDTLNFLRTSEDLTTPKPISDLDSVFKKMERKQKTQITEDKENYNIVSKVQENNIQVKPPEYSDQQNPFIDTFKQVNFLQNIPSDDEICVRPYSFLIEKHKGQDEMSLKTETETNLIPEENTQQNTDWMFGLVTFIVIVVLTAKLTSERYISSFINSMFNYHRSFKLFRDENIFFKRTAFILNITYILSVGLLLYQLISYSNYNSLLGDKPFLSFSVCALCVLGLMMARIIVILLLGYLFDARKVFNEYKHNILLYNKSLGLLAIPFVLTIPFIMHEMRAILLIVAVFVIVFLNFMKIIRGIQIIIKKDVFIFYSILYLCILEILPLLIGYKFVKSLV